MQGGRKIFKFLKFLDEVGAIQKLLKKDESPFTTLKIFTHAASFFYYVLDNILWGITIGVLSDLFDVNSIQKWKDRKDFFSFARNIFHLFITFLKILKYNAYYYFIFDALTILLLKGKQDFTLTFLIISQMIMLQSIAKPLPFQLS